MLAPRGAPLGFFEAAGEAFPADVTWIMGRRRHLYSFYHAESLKTFPPSPPDERLARFPQSTRSMSTWFEDMTKRAREVQRDEAGNLTTESYLHVCEGNLKIFTIIFNGYVTAEVGRQLAAANQNGQSIVRKDLEKLGAAGKTLVSLVKHQVAETGADKLGTPGETSGTKSLLWLNRELTFICKLIRLLIGGEKTASEAGYEAYDTVIKPCKPPAAARRTRHAAGHAHVHVHACRGYPDAPRRRCRSRVDRAEVRGQRSGLCAQHR